MQRDHTEPDDTSQGQPTRLRRFADQLAADNDRNVDLRRWIGISTIIMAAILDLAPLAIFLGQWAIGATAVDENNLGSFLIGAIPAPLFLVSVVTAVWHLVLRRGPRVWPLFVWNVGAFVAALLLGVVLNQVF